MWRSKKLKRQIFFAVMCLLFSFLIPLMQVAPVFASPQDKEEAKAIDWYPNWVADNCSPSADSSSVLSDGSIDITNIVNKYGLQSAMIQKVGDSSALASYKANEPPITPASTMKLIIADTALQSGLDLNKTVRVGPDVYYDGQNDTGRSRITLNEAMILMLSESSNVAANVLMKAMGGVDTFTQKAHNYGYNDTVVKGYYDPSNDGKNTSTIYDEVNAMNHIFSTDGSDYQTAQNALKEAAQSDNYYGVDDVANKWAGTSQVAGNVGLFNINGGQYIIGLYYNGSDSSKSIIKNASADLANAIQNTASGSSTPSSPDNCCPPAGSGGDVTSLTGKDNIEKTINFFLQEGLSLQQAAGIAANLAWETGGGEAIDPLIGGPDPYHSTQGDAWGIAEWTPPSHYTDDKKYMNEHAYKDNPITGSDANLLTQLQVLWGQLQGKGTVYNKDLITDYKKINDPADAANYIRANFEICDTSYSSCLIERPKTAVDLYNQYNGNSLSGSFVSGGSACGGADAMQKGTAGAAAAAAKQLSDMKIGYVWGGLHGSGQLDITDPSKLQQIGADCSGSVSWVLHQAGMLGSTGGDSTALESWGQAGKGQQMTVWANSEHVFIEFNAPGVGHYQLNTVAPGSIPSTTPNATGVGPRFYKWGPPGGNTSGFTPRHWPGT